MGRVLAVTALATVVAAACASPGSEQVYVQASDLVSAGAGFDPGEIIAAASFVDAQGLDSTQVQALLAHSPYGRPSFLATYSSNGVLADDAIVAASQKYQINPLVFLVLAEVAEGLVGAELYPAPSSRVEYVFDCGCAAAGDCDPSLAGFDVQVDCLGNELRASLDAVAANGTTLGGWGPKVTSETTDGVAVTPEDASTAALYQYMPRVAVGRTDGNWLVWNVWQIYASAASYSGPAAGNPTGAWVGDPCTSDGACSYANGICATNYPGGMCTAPCATQADCPSDATPQANPPTFCADFQQAGYCLVTCDPTQASPCRTGYACESVQGFMAASTSQSVCVAM